MDNTRILLLESPYHYLHGKGLVGEYFPLGIGYLAAFARQHGHEVRVFQPPSGATFYEALEATVRTFEPAIVGLSVMTPSYPRAAEICRRLKSSYSVITILGGPHVSAVGRKVLEECPCVDFSIFGEGEQTLVDLLSRLQGGARTFDDVDGLCWRDQEGTVVQNRPRALIEDVDSLPFPARDLVDMGRYRLHSYIDFGRRSATMITSRGCPYNCIFCSSHLTMGRKYRFRTVDSIMAEVHQLVEQYGVDHIVFEDDTITLRRDRMTALCEAFMTLTKRPSWHCLSRVDTMDLSLARLMRKAGCRMVAFGVESGSPKILESIGKKIDLNSAVDAVRACHKAGLRTQCTYIVGFANDTQETMRQTFKAARTIGSTIAIFFPLMPYPGTRVFQESLDPALVPTRLEEWENFMMTGDRSISVNVNYSARTIRATADRMNRRYYLYPGHWPRMLRTISNLSEFRRLARGGLYLLRTSIRSAKDAAG